MESAGAGYNRLWSSVDLYDFPIVLLMIAFIGQYISASETKKAVHLRLKSEFAF